MGKYYSAENAPKEDHKCSGKYFRLTENETPEEITKDEDKSKDYVRGKTREVMWLNAQVRFRNKFKH